MPEQYKVGLVVEIDAKGRPVLRGVRGDVEALDKSIKRKTRTTDRATAADRKARREARAAARASREAAKAERARAKAVRERWSALAGGFGAGGVASGVLGGAALLGVTAAAGRALAGSFLAATNELAALDSQLALVAESETELTRIRAKLTALSRGPYAGTLLETSALYSRLTLETQHLALVEEERIKLIQTIQRAAAISGGGPAVQAATEQLLQGIAGGVLQGQELRSILQQAPGLSVALLDGLQTLKEQGEISIDVTRSNIRKIAEDGELTADRVARAYLAAFDSTEARAASMRVSVGEQWRLLLAEITLAQQGIERRSGIGGGLQQALAALTQSTADRGITGGLNAALNPLLGAAARAQDAAARDRSGLVTVTATPRFRPVAGGAAAAGRFAESPGVRAALGEATRAEELREVTGRGRAFLALQRSLLTVEEQIQAEYEDSAALIRDYAAAAGESETALLALAAGRRDDRLAALEQTAANDAAADAQERQRQAAAGAVAHLGQLREENARLAAGGAAALEAIEAENEARELGLDLAQRFAGVNPVVIGLLVEETLARRDNAAAIEDQADKMAALVAWFQEADTNAAAGGAGVEAWSSGLSVAGEALRNITGGLGQFSAATGRAFRLHKQAAIATAIVSTAEGISRAIGAYSPPTNFIVAATVGAAGAAQLAAIQAQQPPQAFAYGGIIDRRTEFSFGGGRRGVAGEAGLEAILPLRRGPGGRLGVEGGGASRTIVVQVGDVHVQAPVGTDDPVAFGRGAARGLMYEVRPMVREILIDEQRPGGALNRSDRI